jgi:hypothetical protein
MTLDLDNMKKLNKEEKIPIFQGVLYQFRSAPRKMTLDDDEFVDIEEEDNKDHIPTTKQVPIPAQPEQPKKKIDDLFDLLDSTPVVEPTTHLQSNVTNIEPTISMNNFNQNQIGFQGTQGNFPFTPSATMSNGVNFNGLNEMNNFNTQVHQVTSNNEFDDDDFVDVEESARAQTKRESPIKPTESFVPTINTEIKEVVKEINFQDLILNNNLITHQVKVSEINHILDTKINSTDQPDLTSINTKVEVKPKVSLDDLFSELVIDTPIPENKESTESIHTHTTPLQINQIIFDNATEKDLKNEEPEEDEFCDVEETHFDQPNQQVENEFDHINKLPLPDDLFDFTPNPNPTTSSEKKDEPPQVSILNYTPVDFLNEFKKENKILSHDEGAVKTKENEEFDFVEESEQQSHRESNDDANLSTIELLYKYKLNDEFVNKKFKENVEKIKLNLEKELKSIQDNLVLVKNIIFDKKITQGIFEKDRKLFTFLNSTIQILYFFDKFNSLLEEMKEKMESKHKENILKEIKEILKVPSEKFNISQIIDNSAVSEYEEYNPRILKEEIKNNKICHICLHKLEGENNTNVFSYDFHIVCINFWLNLVDNQSPFHKF